MMGFEKFQIVDPACLQAFDPEQLIQVLHVHLLDGRVLVFLGPPMSESEINQIQQITLAERISTTMLLMSAQQQKLWMRH